VLELLLEALLERRLSYGAIVDGFPRTTVQVECVKLLYDKMFELRRKFFNTPLRDEFSRPKFRICVLFVDENESLRRQLARGQAARAHNDFVRQHDVGRWPSRAPQRADVGSARMARMPHAHRCARPARASSSRSASPTRTKRCARATALASW